MLTQEIATYLASAGLGLTVGTNLFEVPFPTQAPDVAVAVVDPDNTDSIGSFGDSQSAYDVERPELLILVRGAKDELEAARTAAQSVYKKLRRLGPVEISGVLYHNIEARPPRFEDYDSNERPVFSFRCDVWKAESP